MLVIFDDEKHTVKNERYEMCLFKVILWLCSTIQYNSEVEVRRSLPEAEPLTCTSSGADQWPGSPHQTPCTVGIQTPPCVPVRENTHSWDTAHLDTKHMHFTGPAKIIHTVSVYSYVNYLGNKPIWIWIVRTNDTNGRYIHTHILIFLYIFSPCHQRGRRCRAS